MNVAHGFQKIPQYQRRRDEFENAVNEQEPGQQYQDSRGIQQREQNPVLTQPVFPLRKFQTEVQEQWRQQCRCRLVQPEYSPIERVEFASEAVDKQDERSQTDKIKMNGQRRSISANQNKDSSQQVVKSDDFKEETLTFQPRRNSGNIQRLLNNTVGAANRVNGLRLSDIIKNPSDVAIALYFGTIDLKQDIASLNSGKLCGPVAYDYLSLYSSRIGLNP
jgi:hypothetical protein